MRLGLQAAGQREEVPQGQVVFHVPDLHAAIGPGAATLAAREHQVAVAVLAVVDGSTQSVRNLVPDAGQWVFK